MRQSDVRREDRTYPGVITAPEGFIASPGTCGLPASYRALTSTLMLQSEICSSAMSME